MQAMELFTSSSEISPVPRAEHVHIPASENGLPPGLLSKMMPGFLNRTGGQHAELNARRRVFYTPLLGHLVPFTGPASFESISTHRKFWCKPETSGINPSERVVTGPYSAHNEQRPSRHYDTSSAIKHPDDVMLTSGNMDNPAQRGTQVGESAFQRQIRKEPGASQAQGEFGELRIQPQ